MDKIKFANGAIYDCSYCVSNDGDGIIPGYAFIVLDGCSLAEYASIFSNPEYIERMEYGGRVLIGYTRLQTISVANDGVIKVGLYGGHTEMLSQEE